MRTPLVVAGKFLLVTHAGGDPILVGLSSIKRVDPMWKDTSVISFETGNSIDLLDSFDSILGVLCQTQTTEDEEMKTTI